MGRDWPALAEDPGRPRQGRWAKRLLASATTPASIALPYLGVPGAKKVLSCDVPLQGAPNEASTAEWMRPPPEHSALAVLGSLYFGVSSHLRRPLHDDIGRRRLLSRGRVIPPRATSICEDFRLVTAIVDLHTS